MTPAKKEDRLEKLGYGPKHARKPLVELDARGRLLVEYMSAGLPQSLADVAARINVKPNEPLTLTQAADLLHIRRRNARWIATQSVFQTALNAEVDAIRSGSKIRAMRRIAELVDDSGDGTAADRKVQLAAAQTVLGEQAKGVSVNVNTQFNNNVVVTPGYVLDLRPDPRHQHDDTSILDVTPRRETP